MYRLMSDKERDRYQEEVRRGLELAEYNMLREKAMMNRVVVVSDGVHGIQKVSARELFVKLYHEPVPTF